MTKISLLLILPVCASLAGCQLRVANSQPALVGAPAAEQNTSVSADSAASPVIVLKRVDASELPSLEPDGDLAALKQALSRQLGYCRKTSGSADRPPPLAFGDRIVTFEKWCLETGTRFLKLAEESKDFAAFYRRARTEFDWYRSTGKEGNGEVQFTGYNFPSLEGSRVPTRDFQVPLYGKPDDLVQVVENGKKVWRRKNGDGSFSKYSDRKAIDVDGSLKGQGLELVYVADPFDAFIFQVQGAGAIHLKGGKTAERAILNYAADNGNTYVSIGKVLREKGVPEKYLTIPGMKVYFGEHPEELMPTLLKNPSYVFFMESSEGPYGIDDILLTPGHSIAIDPSVFPIGGMTLFKTQRPILGADSEVTGWQDFARFALAQDKGGAIKGAGHVDIYFGEDSYAETAAGVMNRLGELYFALVK